MNDDLLNKLKDLATEYGVRKLILFGSALTSFQDARDIDMACEGLHGKKFLRFGFLLEQLFNKPVDLVMLEDRNSFVSEIMMHGVSVYES